MSIPDSQVFDRKVAFYNGSTTEKFDLHACSGAACVTTRDLTPGINDTETEFDVAYGENTDGNPFFEFAFPFDVNADEDVEITEGVHLKLIANPYEDLTEGLIGHGGKGTTDLELSHSKEKFIERPEGPMDGLSIAFNLIFAVLVVGLSLAFILSARSEKIANKLWRVNITEEMANQSLLLELGYYNSSFLSLFSLFFFMLYSMIAFVYGFWARWGVTGMLINGIPMIISIFAFVDLARRNYNPQEIPEEERKQLGRDVEKTGAVWIVPPVFLGLTLFMLVFIGIDVIT
ncbi:MAG: hypothetical protein ACXAB7_21675 [Candidatus Kariarchaeaceae archaeon]|jgi:hypothetical protein